MTHQQYQPQSIPGFATNIKRLLRLSVSLPVLVLAMPAFAQNAPVYHYSDGTMTNDLEAAKTSWREDAEFNGNWGLKAINAEAAYAKGYTGLGSRLGVIDQPVWTGHSEFAGKVGDNNKLTFVTTSGTYVYNDPYIATREPGIPFTYDGAIYVDGRGSVASHGTHVGGIAAANRDTGKSENVGTMGVAYNAQIFAVDNGDPGPEDGEVKGNDGSAYGAAWQAMIDSDVAVVTNSWGIGTKGLPWKYVQASNQYKEIEAILGTPEGGAYDGVLKAAREDIIIEFSAGNDSGKDPDALTGLASFVPDVEKNWIVTMSVQQVQENGIVVPGKFEKSGFSSICGYTKYYCVAAPGSGINSSIVAADITGLAPGTILTDPTQGYQQYSGTSMAGPFVSGSIAVLKERFPYLSNAEINNILKTTSTDMGTAGVDSIFGWGLINLEKAVNGPGQLLGSLEANLAADQSDTWSNDISDVALQQRQTEETSELKGLTAQGIDVNNPEPDLAAVDNYLADQAKQATVLVRDLAEAIGTGNFADELALVERNTIANLLFQKGIIYARTSVRRLDILKDPLNREFAQQISSDISEFLETPRGSVTDQDIETAQAELVSQYDISQDRLKLLSAKSDADYLGSLTKSGAGTLYLTGENTYRGDTTVNGGLLAVDGSITSKAVVNAGGMLGGNGSVGQLLANQGGTITPGASIGTLSVASDAVFKSGSNYLVEVAADGRSDTLSVGGKAKLEGGNVLVTGETSAADLDAAADKKTQFQILTAAGGVEGKFADAVTPYLLFDPKLSYAANGVTLQVDRLAFSSLGTTINEKEVASGIDSLGAGTALYDALLSASDAEAVAQFFASLSGDIYATQQNVLMETGTALHNAATARVRHIFATPMLEEGSAAEVVQEPSSWGQVHGSWVDFDSDGNAKAVKSRQGGVLVGADGMVNDAWTAGVMLGYTDGSVSSQHSKSDIGTLQLGAYGGARWDQLGVRLGASFARHNIESTRYVQGETAQADYDGNSLQAFVETGYEIAQNGTVFEPYIGLAHTRLDLDGFTESGAGDFNLKGEDISTDLTVSTLGLRIGRSFQWGTQTARMSGAISWMHTLGDTDPEARLAFIGGDTFTNRGLPLADDVIALEAGIDVNISETASWGVAYKGQFADDITDNALNASFNMKF